MSSLVSITGIVSVLHRDVSCISPNGRGERGHVLCSSHEPPLTPLPEILEDDEDGTWNILQANVYVG